MNTKNKNTKVKKKEKVVTALGRAYVTAGFNNTIVTLTDSEGNALYSSSAGKAGFKGSRKSTPYAATKATETIAQEAKKQGWKIVLMEESVMYADSSMSQTDMIIKALDAKTKAAELAKGNQKIGSTLKGIGPAYMDKTGRNGLRVGDLLDKNFTTQYIKLRLKHQRVRHQGLQELEQAVNRSDEVH